MIEYHLNVVVGRHEKVLFARRLPTLSFKYPCWDFTGWTSNEFLDY